MLARNLCKIEGKSALFSIQSFHPVQNLQRTFRRARPLKTLAQSGIARGAFAAAQLFKYLIHRELIHTHYSTHHT